MKKIVLSLIAVLSIVSTSLVFAEDGYERTPQSKKLAESSFQQK